MTRALGAAALAALLLAPAVRAQQFQTFAGFEIHYNAVSAEFISPDVARQFGLSRTKSRALVNITVLKVGSGDARTANQATVAGRITAPSAQTLLFRPIREAEGLSYVAEFDLVRGVSNYSFELTVKPEGAERAAPLSFSQELVGP